MESPIGGIYVEETKDNQEFTFYLEKVVLGRTMDLEKWNSIALSTNGKKLIGMVNRDRR